MNKTIEDPSKKSETLAELSKLTTSFAEDDEYSLTCLHQWQGVWLNKKILDGVILCQRDFQARDNDIILATFPKSGTTWLKAIMYAVTQRDQFPNMATHPVLSSNSHELVPFLESIAISAITDTVDFHSGNSSNVFSTHLPSDILPQSVWSSGCKIVYLCRNPKDTFVSAWHFWVNLVEGKQEILLGDVVEMFCNDKLLYGPYWEHVVGYWKRASENPEKILFLKYEDLVKNPNDKLRELAAFLGCPFTREEEADGVPNSILNLCSFENMSSSEVNKAGTYHSDLLNSTFSNKAFFRKGQVGDWVNFLTDDMAKKIDQIACEKFGSLSLNFDYGV